MDYYGVYAIARYPFSKFYRFALEKDTILTIAIKQMITPFAFGNIYFKNDFVTNIEEKPNFVAYVLAGIYAMKPGILAMSADVQQISRTGFTAPLAVE